MEAQESQTPDLQTRDKHQVSGVRLRWIGLFGGFLVLFYFAWVTGFTFRFQEAQIFPNYNMLARAFAKGQLYIDESPGVDYLLFQNRNYLYFGPVPVLFHAPLTLFGGTMPTGLAIALLTAGSAVLFYMILSLLPPPGKDLQLVKLILTIVFAFNGFTLSMVAIPSIHNEAILAGAFFLLGGTYCVCRAFRDSWRLSYGNAGLCGLFFALSIGSRFSYLFTALFFSGLLIGHAMRNCPGSMRRKTFTACAIMLLPIVAGVGLQLLYNYLRFAAVEDFGVKHMTSLYAQYFAEGNYFRWDHIPYNMWSYLFRLPDFVAHMPFIDLPFYYLEVKSFQSMHYHLLNVNELSASVLVLMPILVFAIIPIFSGSPDKTDNSLFRIFLIAVALQILPLSATIASIARYYMDFLPFMLIVTFLGYRMIVDRLSSKYFLLVLTAIMSVVLSFSIVLNGLPFYADLIEFKSPLLKLW
jgi:hypothetical protein